MMIDITFHGVFKALVLPRLVYWLEGGRRGVRYDHIVGLKNWDAGIGQVVKSVRRRRFRHELNFRDFRNGLYYQSYNLFLLVSFSR